MKNVRLLLLVLFISLFTGSAISQQKMGGKVVEIIDGKTMIIEMTTGKLTAVLHYIEIPEPEQPLNQTVKDHLRNLVLGKYVNFEPRGIMPTKTLGQVFLNGVDIGQQMVRDGAAWHMPATKTGQNQEESDSYENYQALARSEKRGVWSIQDLKPAWEFRAEKLERARREEELQWQKASTSKRMSVVENSGVAAKPRIGVSYEGALIRIYDAERKTGRLQTPPFGIKDVDGVRTATCGFAYFYSEETKKGKTGYYTFFITSVSDQPRFRVTDLNVLVDGSNSLVGKGTRTERSEGGSVIETVVYNLKRNTLEKIVNGNDVVLKIGNYNIVPKEGFQLLLFNLLDGSK